MLLRDVLDIDIVNSEFTVNTVKLLKPSTYYVEFGFT